MIGGLIPQHFLLYVHIVALSNHSLLRSLVLLFYVDTSSPLIREIVQLRRMLVGKFGSSNTKGPALGSVSASAAVMLTPLTFLFIRSQI